MLYFSSVLDSIWTSRFGVQLRDNTYIYIHTYIYYIIYAAVLFRLFCIQFGIKCIIIKLFFFRNYIIFDIYKTLGLFYKMIQTVYVWI